MSRRAPPEAIVVPGRSRVSSGRLRVRSSGSGQAVTRLPVIHPSLSDLGTSSRPGCVLTGSRRLWLQAAHLAVSQPVVDEAEQSPGDGDAGDVLVVAPLSDRLVAFS